mgnify:CR=1 FL=1
MWWCRYACGGAGMHVVVAAELDPHGSEGVPGIRLFSVPTEPTHTSSAQSRILPSTHPSLALPRPPPPSLAPSSTIVLASELIMNATPRHPSSPPPAPRSELDEKRSRMSELEQQVAELTMQTEYQLRLKDLHLQVRLPWEEEEGEGRGVYRHEWLKGWREEEGRKEQGGRRAGWEWEGVETDAEDARRGWGRRPSTYATGLHPSMATTSAAVPSSSSLPPRQCLATSSLLFQS